MYTDLSYVCMNQPLYLLLRIQRGIEEVASVEQTELFTVCNKDKTFLYIFLVLTVWISLMLAIPSIFVPLMSRRHPILFFFPYLCQGNRGKINL